MKYFFPKLQKTVEAESLEKAVESLQPKKEKNVGKDKKTSKNK